MNLFMYRHRVLGFFVLYIPFFSVLAVLTGLQIIDPMFAGFTALWLIPMLLIPARRLYPALVTKAERQFYMTCNPEGYLADLAKLERRRMPPDHRVSLAVHRMCAYYAMGERGRAMSLLAELEAGKEKLPAAGRLYLLIKETEMTVFACEGIDALYALQAKAERELAAEKTPGSMTEQVLALLRDMIGEGLAFWRGEHAALKEKYISLANELREEPRLKYQYIEACTWLARIYAKEERVAEACAMYGHVQEHGAQLGVVREAAAYLAEKAA